MRIGVMLRHFGEIEGGVMVYTRNILIRLLERKDDNEYFLIYGHPKWKGTYSRFHKVREIVLRMPTKLLWDQVGVPLVCMHYKLDVLFNPKFTIPFWGRVKKALVIHGSEWFVHPEFYRPLDKLYFSTLIPFMYRRADALIAISRHVKREIVHFTKTDEGKVHPVYHGFDHSRFRIIDDPKELNRIHRKFSLPKRFLFWVGWIYPGKNLRRLLQAFARIQHRIPHKLVLAGEQRWKGARLGEEREWARELGIADQVVFTGPLPNDSLPYFYNLAEAFVFPSLYEGFGIPLIEAMACGCPILSANTCAVPEVVGEAGLLVDPEDEEAISKGIETLCLHEQERSRLRKLGLVRAQAFNWDLCAEQTWSVLESLHPPVEGVGKPETRQAHTVSRSSHENSSNSQFSQGYTTF